MKKTTYTCDKCKKEWDLRYNPKAFVLGMTSLTGAAIMGDNRMTEDKYFCEDCFERYLVPIIS